ncbi:MAG: hypothetical protein OXC06_06510, partial [Acidimicrobiaceae bacterium]|nr:hypothetical protein [Acidimicrobiaceae bacterium]
MSLELVLLVPVLVLLAVFVLWAGRGGRAGLTADLAAEEAATAAAVCCEEGDDGIGPGQRETVAADMLRSRPGLDFLCIGGPRGNAGSGSDEDDFVDESWVEFEAGRDSGGVGVLGVRFVCETDGAVAPLRGLFPTVTFHGQASEVVLREPIETAAPNSIWIEPPPDPVNEGESLVFTVHTDEGVPQDTRVQWRVDTGVEKAAELAVDFVPGTLESGTVTILAGENSAEIPPFKTVADGLYEGNEILVLDLVSGTVMEFDGSAWVQSSRVVANDRSRAVGRITDLDPKPSLWIPASLELVEGDGTGLGVRLTGPSQAEVTVQVSTEDLDPVEAVGGDAADCNDSGAVPDYVNVDQTLTFPSGAVVPNTPVELVTCNDADAPLGEPAERFRVTLGAVSDVDGRSTLVTIIDNEVTVSAVAPLRANEGTMADEGTVRVGVSLDGPPDADVVLSYYVENNNDPGSLGVSAMGRSDCTAPAVLPPDYVATDFVTSEGTLTFMGGSVLPQRFDLELCPDTGVEPDETLWISLERVSGEVYIGARNRPLPDGGGARFTIRNDDGLVISAENQSGDEGGSLTFSVNLTNNGVPVVLGGRVSVDFVLEEDVPQEGRPVMAAVVCSDYRRAGVEPGDCGNPDPAVSGLEGTLEFGPGTAAAQTIEVELLDDYEREGDETFRLVLSDGDGDDIAELDKVFAVGTIRDDPPPVVSVGDFEGREGTERSFAVTLAGARPGETVTVDYEVAGHGDPPNAANPSGSPPADFEMRSQTDRGGTRPGGLTGSLTLDAANPAASVGVFLLPDTVTEVVEQLSLTLSNPSRAALFDRDPGFDADRDGDPANDAAEAYGVGTIFDVDGPDLCVLDTSAREGTTMTFTVVVINPRLVGGVYETVTAAYRVEARSADEGVDFEQPAAGTLTFDDSDRATLTQAMRDACDPPADAGGTVLVDETVTVEILTDKIAENPETLHLVLTGRSPGHVGLAKAIGVGTVVNVNAAVVRVNNPEAPEGDRDRPLEFVISLVDDQRNAVDRIAADVTVAWQTDDRTATAGADYTAVSGSYTFTVANVANGDTTRTVEVATLADTLNEDDETMVLRIALVDSDDNPDNDAAVLGDAEGTGTIIDAPPPALHVGDASGDEGATLEFYVRLGVRDAHGRFVERATDQTVSVRAGTADFTATAPEDYTAVTEDLTFAPGDTSKTVRVPTVRGRLGGEGRERFHMVLSENKNALLDRDYGVGTISPECRSLAEAVPTLTLQDASGFEDSQVFPNSSFSHPICDRVFPMEIRWRFDGTATRADISGVLTSRSDNIPGTYTYPPPSGTTGGASLARDGLDEDDETYTVDLRIADRGQPWSSATVTIRDIDPPPLVTIGEASGHEGGRLEFPVTLNTPSGRTVALEYRTADTGSATAGADFTPADWTRLEIDEGDTSVPIRVPALSDTDDSESDETFQVELRIPPGDAADPTATIADRVAVGTILVGDRPRLSIADARGDENGDVDIEFEVTLSRAAAADVEVFYETVEQPAGFGRATEGVDYTAAAAGASVTIPRGRTSATIGVRPLDDDEPEGDETFLVDVTEAAGVSLADASAVGTIVDDEVSCVDPASRDDLGEQLEFTVSSPRVPESAGVMDFTVTLPTALCRFASFVVNENTAPRRGTATAGEDYVFFDNYNFIMPRLTTEYTVRVNLLDDDDLDEPDETILLRFQSYPAPNTRIVIAEGTIVDNDTEPAVSVAAVSAVEGEALGFTVRLDRPSGRDVSVDYETVDLAAGDNAATAGADYRGVSGTATIAAGDLSATVAVNTVEDRLDEATERFEFRLSSPDGAVLATGADTALGSIIDDDDPPAVRIFDAAADEADPLVFALRLDGPSGRTTSVDWTTVDGTGAGAAVAPGDYTAASGTVEFEAGETFKTVTVQSKGDDAAEGDEQFFVDLSNRPLLIGGDDRAVGTIRDVTQRRLSVSDAFAREGRALGFRVGFDGPASSRDVTVRYRTVAGTAAAVDDYSDRFESAGTARGLVRILAGRSSATIWVATVDDRLDEDAERLRLVLSDPDGAVFADGGGEAVGVIIDDDPLPELSVDDPEATENGDGVPITFTVSLSEISGRTLSVDFVTEDGTAEAVKDYVAVSDGGASIGAGRRSVELPVALVDDDDAEGLER